MNIRKLFCPGNTPQILLFLFFFIVSVITTIACGYTEKNATGNVLLLFLLLLLAHRNTLTSITALLFLFCCALYAPAGMTYGKINNSFIVALLQTTTDEAAEFTGMIPVYHFLVSAAILVFMVIFWRTHHRGHRNGMALLLFVLCSVNSWPLRMVKGTVVGTTDTLREMQHYKQLSQHGADNWKILPGTPLYDTIVIVTGESVRRDYMSVYGYPVPTTPWLNMAPGLFIDGYTSAAARRWQQKQDTAHGGYPIRENWGSMIHASLLLHLMRSIPFSSRKAALLPVKRMTCCCYRKQNVHWRINPLRR